MGRTRIEGREGGERIRSDQGKEERRRREKRGSSLVGKERDLKGREREGHRHVERGKR